MKKTNKPLKRTKVKMKQQTKKSSKTKAKLKALAALTLDQTKTLISANNNSGLSNELILAICWKESSFIPDATSDSSSAIGLMMVTKGAVTDVNSNTPQGIHYEYSKLADPAINIQCGTYYLKILVARWGDTKGALEHYGTGPGYADNLLACEICLQSTVVVDPQTCLNQIHT